MMENDAGSASAQRLESDNATTDGPRKLIELSRSSFRAGNHQEALTLVDQAIAINPKISGFHLQRSKILSRLADAQGAIAAARTATTLAPDNAGVKAYLSGLLQKKGAFAPALKLIEQAIALDGSEAAYQRQRAELLEALGDTAAAGASAVTAPMPDPEDVQSQATSKPGDAEEVLPPPSPAEPAPFVAAPLIQRSPIFAEPAESADPSNKPAIEEIITHRSEATRLLEEIQKPVEKARPALELSARKLPMGSRQDLDSLPQLTVPRLSPVNPFPPRPQGARNDREETRRTGFFARLLRWFS